MSTNRYENAKIYKDTDGKRYYSTVILNTTERSVNDLYINSKSGDRLDLLAKTYYGDVRYWWVIALANNLGKGTMIVPSELQLRIPSIN